MQQKHSTNDSDQRELKVGDRIIYRDNCDRRGLEYSMGHVHAIEPAIRVGGEEPDEYDTWYDEIDIDWYWLNDE